MPRSQDRLVDGKVVAAVDARAARDATALTVTPLAKSATRAEWDAHATSLGLNPDDYASKEDLIKATEK